MSGVLEESKGAGVLIRAAGEVRKQLPEMELVLIGEGSLRDGPDARQQLRRYRFLGLRTSEEAVDESGIGSLCAVGHKALRGGRRIRNSLARSGQTVVAFNSGGISEVLAEEGDWQTLAEYLLMRLRSTALRAQFGRSGRQWNRPLV